MKACARCQRLYPDDAGFCPIDGTPLHAASAVPVAPDPEDRRIGSTICGGRYQVRRKVADGGMGRVYQALDLYEQRSVAIKVLHAEVALDEVQVERFKREWELSASLPHEHIVEVLEFQSTEDGSYALVMEYLEGEELRTFLQREKLVRPERMVRLLSQLAIGLREPHQLQLVHRDIKPDNIFLCGTPDGPMVKLLDFGSVRDNSEGAKKLTMIGTTIGSPYYMAPEQAQGLASLDHRADVWSIAAIAYECLTGRVPFHGSTGPQILLAILSHEPQPPSIVTNASDFAGVRVPEAVDDVIADALVKDPGIRIASVAELADRFGRAWGLQGSHLDWARGPESELAAAIEAPGAHDADRQSAEQAQQYADFHARMAAMDAAMRVPRAGGDELILAAPPRSGSSTVVYLVVGLGLLAAIGAIAFFLL